MIVPTTILSLAALSAAESNSSRNRGLRKSSTPWTAIAVVSGTAITGVVIGGLIGWFLKSGSAGGPTACPEGTKGCVPYVAPKGCAVDYLLTAKETCEACDDGRPTLNSEILFSAADGSENSPYEKKDGGCAATGCRADFHQAANDVCTACGAGQYIAASGAVGAGSEQPTCTGCKAGWVQSAGDDAGVNGACTKCTSGTTAQAEWVNMPTATPKACA